MTQKQQHELDRILDNIGPLAAERASSHFAGLAEEARQHNEPHLPELAMWLSRRLATHAKQQATDLDRLLTDAGPDGMPLDPLLRALALRAPY